MAPTNKQWRLNGFSGFDSIVLKDGSVPPVGDTDVLVRWKYASLNYRDLVISKVEPISISQFQAVLFVLYDRRIPLSTINTHSQP